MGKADVNYEVDLDSKKFDKSSRSLDNQFRKMKISANDFGKSAGMSLMTMAAGAGGAVIAFKVLGDMIEQVSVGVEKFNIQQKAEATLEQTLKATGYAAGLTAIEIKDMASELQGLTTFGDEAIISSSNLLLTFKQVGEETFPRAQKAILDVSAAMGQDLKSSSIQVGKALNDPIAGMTAMSRVGITFTDTQKELVKGFIKVNDLASAQGVILTELESQFGGVAEAQAKTDEGVNKQIDNLIGDFQEKIGEGFSGEMTKSLTELLDSLTTAAPELADLAVSFGKIAGFLVSVPTNALTGWIDLFHASSAGETRSISNKQVKAIAEANDNIKSEITAQLGLYGLTDSNKSLEGLGGATAVESLFKDAFLGDDKAFNTIFNDSELLEVYRNMKDNLKQYTNAVEENKRVLDIANEKKKKITDAPSDMNGKFSGMDFYFMEKMRGDFDSQLQNTLTPGAFNPGAIKLDSEINSNSYEDVSKRMIGGSGELSDVNSMVDKLTISLIDSDNAYHEAMLEAQIQFYSDSISIISSSESTIVGLHDAFTSGDLSGQLGGASGAVGGVSSILGTLGMVDPSGITGIASGLLGVGSTLASFFGGDDEESGSSAQAISETSASSKANIVSSGPENIYVTNTFTITAGYIGDTVGTNEFFEQEIGPRVASSTIGVL